MLYRELGYTKVNPPPGIDTYASVVLRRRKRNMLMNSIALLLVAVVGLLLLAVWLVALTPAVPR